MLWTNNNKLADYLNVRSRSRSSNFSCLGASRFFSYVESVSLKLCSRLNCFTTTEYLCSYQESIMSCLGISSQFLIKAAEATRDQSPAAYAVEKKTNSKLKSSVFFHLALYVITFFYFYIRKKWSYPLLSKAKTVNQLLFHLALYNSDGIFF